MAGRDDSIAEAWSNAGLRGRRWKAARRPSIAARFANVFACISKTVRSLRRVGLRHGSRRRGDGRLPEPSRLRSITPPGHEERLLCVPPAWLRLRPATPSHGPLSETVRQLPR